MQDLAEKSVECKWHIADPPFNRSGTVTWSLSSKARSQILFLFSFSFFRKIRVYHTVIKCTLKQAYFLVDCSSKRTTAIQYSFAVWSYLQYNGSQENYLARPGGTVSFCWHDRLLLYHWWVRTFSSDASIWSKGLLFDFSDIFYSFFDLTSHFLRRKEQKRRIRRVWLR